jgi:hypothetical protein
MDERDVREPRRDRALAEQLERATPEPPFSEQDFAAFESRVLNEGTSLMRRRRRAERARWFGYRVALPAALAAELIIGFRLMEPTQAVPPAVPVGTELIEVLTLGAMMETDVGAAIIAGDAFTLALATDSNERDPDDG